MKKFTTILNYFGLTVAFTAFMVVAVQVQWDAGFNHCFKDYGRVYRIEAETQNEGFWSSTVCRPLCELTRGVKGIEASGLHSWIGNLKWSAAPEPDAASYEAVCTECDSALIDLLGLEITSGSLERFDSLQSSAIISDRLAQRLFPGEDAVGKSIFNRTGNGDARMFTVTAVFRALPSNAWPNCDLLASICDSFKEVFSEWSFTGFVRLAPGAEPDSVAWDVFAAMAKRQGTTLDGFDHCPLKFTGLADLHFSKDADYMVPKADGPMLVALSAAALLVLLIALINFFNVSMAGVPAMARGINIRKIMGATRESLVMGQLLRTLLLAALAFVSAVGFVWLLGHTAFAGFISGSLNPADNVRLILPVAAACLVASILAGIWPALYSTSFPPAFVLKTGFAHSSNGRVLRGVLVGVQYVVSMALMVFALFIKVQTDFMRGHDKGFRSSQVVTSSLPASVAARGSQFSESLMKHTGIMDVTYSNQKIAHVDGIAMSWGRSFKGNGVYFSSLPVAHNFLGFFGLEIEEGRAFLPSDEQKESGCYIFNRTAADLWDIRVGDTMEGHNGNAPIVGIAKDFNFKPLQYAVEPMALYQFGQHPWRALPCCYVRISGGVSLEEAAGIMLAECRSIDPKVKADDVKVEYLDEALNDMYRKEERLSTLISIACGLSVLISIVGILGLIHYETQFRRREIGIRRVLGATIGEILAMLNAKYACICLLCFGASAPIALLVIRRWLEGYAYKAAVPAWIFVAALAAVLLVVCMSVTLKSLRTVMASPVEAVKTE